MKNTYGFPVMHKLIPQTSEPRKNGFFIQHMKLSPSFVRHEQRMTMFGGEGWTVRGLEPGTYCTLKEKNENGGNIWMSDTWMERWSNEHILRDAYGDVLILGLGIGMIPAALCKKRSVLSITVVELNKEVIRLVAPHIRHRKLKVIEGDAIDPAWKGREFDVIYLDIWPNIAADNWEQMKSLLRKYRKFVRKGGIVRAWMKERIQALVQEGRRGSNRWW